MGPLTTPGAAEFLPTWGERDSHPVPRTTTVPGDVPGRSWECIFVTGMGVSVRLGALLDGAQRLKCGQGCFQHAASPEPSSRPPLAAAGGPVSKRVC